MAVSRYVLLATDRRLHALLRADGSTVELEIERLVLEARPLIDAILSRYRRSESVMAPEDADDVRATILLRLFEKLRALRSDAYEPIQNFQSYVATLTYNAVSDFLRAQFPERARLKKRVRYALTTDPRLSMSQSEAGSMAGLAGSAEPAGASSPTPSDTAQAIVAILQQTRQPLLVDDLVDILYERSRSNVATVDVETAAVHDDPSTRLEDRDFACILWEEIRQLRPGQRKALLLNLRYGGDLDVITVLVMSGIATFADLAQVLEMSYEELMTVWNDLPLEDARIAEMLNLTRQQVINLRKSARDRLSRRLPR